MAIVNFAQVHMECTIIQPGTKSCEDFKSEFLEDWHQRHALEKRVEFQNKWVVVKIIYFKKRMFMNFCFLCAATHLNCVVSLNIPWL